MMDEATRLPMTLAEATSVPPPGTARTVYSDVFSKHLPPSSTWP